MTKEEQEQLKRDLDTITAQIDDLCAKRDALRRYSIAAQRRCQRAEYCVRVACSKCHGEKSIPRSRADMSYCACDDCDGRGWVWAVRADRLPLPKGVQFEALLED